MHLVPWMTPWPQVRRLCVRTECAQTVPRGGHLLYRGTDTGVSFDGPNPYLNPYR